MEKKKVEGYNEESKKELPKKAKLEVEINGEWVDSKKAPLSAPVTGVRFNMADVKVKTTNGWFDETDPEKEPVTMIEVDDDSLKLAVHVKGGEWLPLVTGKAGCGVPIDGVSFVKM